MGLENWLDLAEEEGEKGWTVTLSPKEALYWLKKEIQGWTEPVETQEIQGWAEPVGKYLFQILIIHCRGQTQFIVSSGSMGGSPIHSLKLHDDALYDEGCCRLTHGQTLCWARAQVLRQ